MPSGVAVFVIVMVCIVCIALFVHAARMMKDSLEEDIRLREREELARKATEEDVKTAVAALLEVFNTWRQESGQLDAIALELGVSRHRLKRECSLLAAVALEDAIARSIVQNKETVRYMMQESVAQSIGALDDSAAAALGRYSSRPADPREACSASSLVLGAELSSRVGIPLERATELAGNVHGLVMRAGLLALDELN